MDIRLKGVKNIRDFSEFGYKGFIRSAHLNGLTPRGAGMLRERYDLRTVIDLRTSKEAEEKPDADIPGATRLHIPIFDGPVPGISHEDETDRIMSMIPDMPRLYRLLATEESHVRQFMKVMDVINDPEREGGILWHCTEGKDRCGIVSALFLLSRGAEPQAVMDDYLSTNRANRAKAIRYYALMLLATRDRAAAGKVSGAFLAKREYLGPIMGELERIASAYK